MPEPVNAMDGLDQNGKSQPAASNRGWTLEKAKASYSDPKRTFRHDRRGNPLNRSMPDSPMDQARAGRYTTNTSSNKYPVDIFNHSQRLTAYKKQF